MPRIEVESEALDSIKAMAQRLQEERDECLEALDFYASMMGRRLSNGEPFYMHALDHDCGDRARTIIAKCTSSPKVME